MGRSRLRAEAIAATDSMAPDLIPTFVRTLRRWSAWSRSEGGMGVGAEAESAWGGNVVAFPRLVDAAGARTGRRRTGAAVRSVGMPAIDGPDRETAGIARTPRRIG